MKVEQSKPKSNEISHDSNADHLAAESSDRTSDLYERVQMKRRLRQQRGAELVRFYVRKAILEGTAKLPEYVVIPSEDMSPYELDCMTAEELERTSERMELDKILWTDEERHDASADEIQAVAEEAMQYLVAQTAQQRSCDRRTCD